MTISIITTSRADWNGLGMLAKALMEAGAPPQIIAIHPQHPGATPLEVLEADGFRLGLGGLPGFLSSSSVTKLAADTLAGIGCALEERRTDMLVLLGDRYETLMAATAAVLAGIPVAHLDGGDETEGAWDNAMRHAITKLSSLHFVCTERHGRRVIQMGEHPLRVHRVGSTHVDRLLQTPLLSRELTLELLKLSACERFVLVNWQPETLSPDPNAGLEAILKALDGIPTSVSIQFVGQNADAGGSMAKQRILHWLALNATHRAKWDQTLDPVLYLSALTHCSCLIGNSSSAYFEAPYLGTWAIDVGDRQRGRGAYQGAPPNVRRSPVHYLSQAHLNYILESGPAPLSHPYGGSGAAERIVESLARIPDPKALLRKRFHEVA